MHFTIYGWGQYKNALFPKYTESVCLNKIVYSLSVYTYKFEDDFPV